MSSLYRNIDLFLHKRIRHLDEYEASKWGAAVSVAAVVLSFYLVLQEGLNYMTPSVHSDIMMDTSIDSHLDVHFNVTFPNLPCQFTSVDVRALPLLCCKPPDTISLLADLQISDVLGVKSINITRNINKYTVNWQQQRRLHKVRTRALAPTTVDLKHEGSEHTFLLDEMNWDSFMASHDLVLVAFMAPWCPWCKRLMPILEATERILEESGAAGDSSYAKEHAGKLKEHFTAGAGSAWMMAPDTAELVAQRRGPPPSGVVAPGLPGRVGIAKVDCTTPLGEPLCRKHRVAAFPTITLFRPMAGDSHVHFYGPRSPEALLTFMTGYEHMSELREDQQEAFHDVGEGADARDVQKALHEARRSALKTATGADSAGLSAAGKWAPVGDGAPLWAKLASAMRKAGIPAPGDDFNLDNAPMALGAPKEGAAAERNLGDAQAAAAKKDSKPAPVLGCNIDGTITVSRVPGKLILTLDHGGHSLNPGAANLTHVVHSLSFGAPLTEQQTARLPATTLAGLHQLDEAEFISPLAHVHHEHFVRVVGARFNLHGQQDAVATYKYSVNSHMFLDSEKPPAAVFSYDLSPLSVVTTEDFVPLYKFVTSLCAIVGGVFTVLGLLDSIVYKGMKSVQRKQALGKLG